MSNNRITMSRDRLAELRANTGYEHPEPLPPMPTAPVSSYRQPPIPSYRQNYYEDYADPRQSPHNDNHSPYYQQDYLPRYQQRYHQQVPQNPPARIQHHQVSPDHYSRSEPPQRNRHHNPNPQNYEMGERSPGKDNMQAFFNEVEDIKIAIKEINEDISRVDELHSVSLDTVDPKQGEWVRQQLDALLAQIKRKNAKLKEKIKSMEIENAKMKDSGDLQIRKTQHANLKKKFMETIRRFQDIEHTHQGRYRMRIERQIRIVKPEATEEEVEAIMDSDQAEQIFSQSVLQSNRSGQVRAVLSEVQNRHDDIKKIEKTILELHALFQDMSQLVEQQAEVINDIEQYADTAVLNIEAGTKEMDIAVVSAQKARSKKKWCFLLLVILLIVVGVVVYFQVIDPMLKAKK
ncbi:uncharacterized protein VTP21DRAFT_939 [Calcarisporiella thermophila]|uniref:uncharacterized protein n=1 Tax=Calcarisporiella thermophila TaxID=911321 RepID=UPI003742A37E